ncbi:MAG: hypothetical protein EXR38_00520 [Methylotenera sp.]|nr:hypothetical protein [Methylotenera sp.]
MQLDLDEIESLQLQTKNNLKKQAENQSHANSYIKKNKPIPADLSAEIKNNQAEVAKQELQINARKETLEKTRSHFKEDKIRFNVLKNKANQVNTLAETPSSTKP